MLTHPAFLLALGGLLTFAASSGFWAYILHRSKSNNAERKLLLALTYDRIIDRGLAFIERGWVSRDEYEELLDNLYEPYKQLGGNGTAEKVMGEVTSLKFRTVRLAEIVIKESKTE